MTGHRAARGKQPRTIVALLVALALLVVAPVTALTRNAPADATTRLAVALTGHLADAAGRADRPGVVAGVVSPSWLPTGAAVDSPTVPFSFTAGCDSSAPCSSTDTVSWDFGDGTTAGGSGLLSTTHAYTTVGAFTARVRVFSPTTSGEATIRVLVSPRFADADAAFPGKPARADAEAIWAVAALGLVTPCRSYLGGTTASPAYDYRADQSQTDPGRAEFCPEPTEQLTPSVTPDTGTSWPMPGPAAQNPVTGADCLSSWSACGLPQQVFADHSASAGSYSDGDPTAACATACRDILQSTGKIDAAGNLVFDPTDCLSDYALTRRAGSWTVTPGVGLGCVSRGEFFTALVRALDGAATGAHGLTSAPADVCTDGAGADGDGLRRAATLLGAATTLRTRDGKTFCDTDAAITKEEAYDAVGKAAGLPAGDPSVLRDLTNRSLGHGTRTPNPLAAADAALFSLAGPLVGSSSCADGIGSCFNPEEALTRSGLAQLLGSLIVSRPALVSGLQIQLSSPTPTAAAGRQVQLRTTVTVPAYYHASDTVTVAWPVPTGGDTRGCAATETATVGSDRQVTLSCQYTPAHRGVVNLTATVTDERGNTAAGALPLTVTNTAPILGTQPIPAVAEGAAAQTTISVRDAEGNPVHYDVRSCTSTDPAPCTPPTSTFAQTGEAPSATWGPTANVAVGSVSAVSVAAGVTVTVSPVDGNANGDYAFVLRACDQDDCTTRVVAGTLTPVNDPPVATPLVTATSDGTQLAVTLSGSDPADAGRSGCASSIAQYRIDSLPAAGTLSIDRDGTYVDATVGDVTGDAVLRWTPPAGAGTWGFTFDVADTGCPGPGLWSTTPGQVMVTSTTGSAPAAPTAALTLTPAEVPTQTGSVTADASASATSDGSPMAGYTFVWGDGTTTGPQPDPIASHVYTGTAGDRTVTVQATDADGRTATGTASVTVHENLLTNPTFDAGSTTSWAPTAGTADVTATTDAPHGGDSALSVVCAGAGNCGVQNTTSVQATSAPHTATLWVRPSAVAVGSTFTLTLTEADPGGTSVSSTQAAATLVAGWQKVTVTYTPTAAGDVLTLSGGIAGYPGSSGAAFAIDDAALFR